MANVFVVLHRLPSMTEREPGIKSTETCFAVVEAVRAGDGVGISQLARETGLSKGAVYKHVRTLLRLGYLVRRGDDYHLSLRFLVLGRQARERLPAEAAESVVANLAETTGHTTNFLVRENDRVVYAFRSRPDAPRADSAEGETAPIHATAGGKAILAHLDADDREAVVERAGLEPYTPKTITTAAALDEELQSVRDRRVAFDREEFVDGHQCVASPVLDVDDAPVGAVSVTGNVHRMSGKRLEEDVVGLVISAAKDIERRIRTG